MLTSLIVVALSQTPPAGKISVTVEIVRNTNGHVRCSLFNTAPGFPGKSPLEGRNLSAAAGNGKVSCEFTNVPAGTWAVTVMHDENDNWSLDTNLVGIPTEGYGATNNKLPTFSAPTFKDSSFALAEGEQRSFTVKLRY